MNKVVLISCSKSKCEAYKLYDKNVLFKVAYRYAETITNEIYYIS
ncbi:hypothetical protein ACTNDG_12340 [Clostridium sp. HCP1S3_B4]